MKRHKGITKIKSRKYLVRARVTDPRTGERKELKRVCNGTLEDALALQEELARELADDSPLRRVTLEDYARQWLENRKSTIKPSTAKKYENDLFRHIVPELGKVYVHALRPRDIVAFLAKQSRSYQGWSVNNRLRLLRVIAKDAQADGLAEMDFCARVRPPRCSGYTEENPNCLTAEQLEALAKAIPPQWYPLFVTMAFTGLRWGEASGLCWADIDHKHGVIRVRRGNWQGQLVEPKTKGSKRTIPMVPELAEILRAHRARMVRERHPGLANGYVFPTQEGTLHKGTPLGPVMRRAAKQAKIPTRITPHGLRRTFNNLARQVAGAQVVRSIVGHVTEAMTEHYSVIYAQEKHAVQAAVLRLVDRNGEGESAESTEAKAESTEAKAESAEAKAEGDATNEASEAESSETTTAQGDGKIEGSGAISETTIERKKSLRGEDSGEDRVSKHLRDPKKPE